MKVPREVGKQRKENKSKKMKNEIFNFLRKGENEKSQDQDRCLHTTGGWESTTSIIIFRKV